MTFGQSVKLFKFNVTMPTLQWLHILKESAFVPSSVVWHWGHMSWSQINPVSFLVLLLTNAAFFSSIYRQVLVSFSELCCFELFGELFSAVGDCGVEMLSLCLLPASPFFFWIFLESGRNLYQIAPFGIESAMNGFCELHLQVTKITKKTRNNKIIGFR